MKNIKKITLLFIALTFLFISCSKKEEKKEEKKVSQSSDILWKFVSKDSNFVLKVKSIEDFYSYGVISKDGTKIFGKELPLDTIKKVTGLNSLMFNELKSAGLDIKSPFAFSINNFNIKTKKDGESKANISIFIPAQDTAKLKSFFVNSIKQSDESKNVKFTEEGSKSFYEKDGKKIVLDNLNNYLGIYFVSDNDYFNKMSKESIIDTPNFKAVCKEINSNEDIFVYGDLKSFYSSFPKKGFPGALGLSIMSKYYKSFGFAINLASKDLKADYYMQLTDHENIKKLFNSGKNAVNFASHEIDMPATGIISATVNPEAYMDILKEALGAEEKINFDKGIKGFEEKTGISLESDLFPAIDGSMALCIYDSASINIMNYNTVLALGVKDKNKAISLVDKLLSKLMKGNNNAISKKKEKDFEIYTVTLAPGRQVYIAINNKNCFLSFNPNQNLTSKILSGDKGDFQKKYAGISLGDFAKDNSIGLYYFNAKEISKLLSIASMWDKKGYIKKAQDVINNFNYLIYYGNKKDNALAGKVELNTNFSSSFVQGINELVKKIPASKSTEKEIQKKEEEK